VPDDLVVLTQNAWGGVPFAATRLRWLAERIRELRPDVIGLQEIHAPDATGAGSQAHAVAGLVPGYHVRFAPARVAGGPCEGVALLCREEPREYAVHALTLDRRDWLERPHQRVVLHARLPRPADPLDVFVTHLSLSRSARARTLPELRAFIARRRHPGGAALLLGDFNASPDEPALADLAGSGGDADGWVDAWLQAHPSGARGGTWPALLLLRRIDYVFVSPPGAWQVKSCDRVAGTGSDHLGVVTRLRLR
jgi:endonuclease/exonuclease/phosphatase family metal-dependent hydrolase